MVRKALRRWSAGRVARRASSGHVRVGQSVVSLRPAVERLEARQLLAADFVISEFMASNDQTLNDGDGHSSDWVELFNAGDETAHLLGWHLTDNALNLNKWSFPDVTLEPGSYLVVFASGKPNDPAAPWTRCSSRRNASTTSGALAITASCADNRRNAATVLAIVTR